MGHCPSQYCWTRRDWIPGIPRLSRNCKMTQTPSYESLSPCGLLMSADPAGYHIHASQSRSAQEAEQQNEHVFDVDAFHNGRISHNSRPKMTGLTIQLRLRIISPPIDALFPCDNMPHSETAHGGARYIKLRAEISTTCAEGSGGGYPGVSQPGICYRSNRKERVGYVPIPLARETVRSLGRVYA